VTVPGAHPGVRPFAVTAELVELAGRALEPERRAEIAQHADRVRENY